jgi:hypothetical protein
LLVAEFDQFFFEPRHQVGDLRAVLGLVGEALGLVRIGSKVEELRFVDLWVSDQLPAVVTNRSLDGLVTEDQLRASGLSWIVDDSGQLGSFTGGRAWYIA